MKNNYYIYIYLDSRKSGRYCYENFSFLFEPFYIGKGKNERCLVKYGRNDDFIDIINEIKNIGLEPIVLKLYENLNEEESFELETKSINEIGRIDLGTGILINKTSGGQGSNGRPVLEETLKKYRINFLTVKKEFEKRNYILLTEEKDYKTNKTKLKYICPKGHDGFISWHNFQQYNNHTKYNGCPICCNKLRSENNKGENNFNNKNHKIDLNKI